MLKCPHAVVHTVSWIPYSVPRHVAMPPWWIVVEIIIAKVNAVTLKLLL